MGNRSSRTNDWSSDEGGGSDYEHAYNYHTSVLHKSPADGFESDYEDEDDDPVTTRTRSLRALPARNLRAGSTSDAATSTSAAVKVGDRGDKNSETTLVTNSVVEKTPGSSGSEGNQRQSAHERGDAQASELHQFVSAQAASSGSKAGDKAGSDHHKQTSCSTKQAASHVRPTSEDLRQTVRASQHSSRSERNTGECDVSGGAVGGTGNAEEEVYETAGEGSGEERAEVGSDEGSLSTITPPRTRPQSDSDYTVSEETQEDGNSEEESVEEEEGNDDDVSDYDTERVASPASRFSLANQHETRPSRSRVPVRFNSPVTDYRSSQTAQARLPNRQEMSPQSYCMARKRPPSPKPEMPLKRSRPSDGINFSPDRTRFGIFDSESESDNTSARQQSRKRRAALPSSPSASLRAPPEKRTLSARTLRQAARQAATQFVETSRKILRDAKTAARILRESTSKRRSSTTLEQEEGPSSGKKSSPEKRETRSSPRTPDYGGTERKASSRQTVGGTSVTNRKGAVKRKAEDTGSPQDQRKRWQREETDTDSDSDAPLTRSASWRQVRKDGGQRRKFTRNNTTASSHPTRRSPRLFPSVPSGSHTISLPVLPGASNDSARPCRSSTRGARQNSSFPSAITGNPFQNVTLRPSPSKAKTTGSIDSISHELGGVAEWSSPFSTLLTDDTRRPNGPQELTLSAGSVWARISTRGTVTSPPQRNQECSSASPTPGPSGTRMATRATPQQLVTAYPARSTPRVPSLTLTGQFSQSGRFAFLLENILQVTVVNNNITTAATGAIVITTDSRLQHQSPIARSVAGFAGREFTQACQDFLRRHAKGLQVCEVLDTPAGGQLSPLISHVLHVVVPETETSTSQGVNHQRKLLLCTYLNCLKHASEKLGLSSLGCPLIGSDTNSADECVQVFFDSLLVYLAERTQDCPLHAVQLLIAQPALASFAAEVLEARLQALRTTGVDTAMAAVFRDYFNIPDFTRSSAVTGNSMSPQVSGERNPSGKPAVKRRRL